VSYFSQPKDTREMKIVNTAETRPAANGRSAPETVSTLGQGMLITGNIVCAGPLNVYGRVVGDIHASQLTIGEGAKVEGKVIAPETVIQGEFHGTIQSNTVKLQETAVVEGEIFNKSLAIEQTARFEGVSRRLERPVEAPTMEQITGEAPPVVPVQSAAFQGAPTQGGVDNELFA